MILQDIVDSVSKKILDKSITEEDYIYMCNECQYIIADSIYTPNLQTSTTLTCDGNETLTLPNDFSKNIFVAINLKNNLPIKIFESPIYLLKEYPLSSVGDVFAISLFENKKIIIRNVPNDNQQIKIFYYKNPEVIKRLNVDINYIPESYVYTLFYNFICFKYFQMIEEGVNEGNEGIKINSNFYYKLFMNKLQELQNKYSNIHDIANRDFTDALRFLDE